MQARASTTNQLKKSHIKHYEYSNLLVPERIHVQHGKLQHGTCNSSPLCYRKPLCMIAKKEKKVFENKSQSDIKYAYQNLSSRPFQDALSHSVQKVCQSSFSEEEFNRKGLYG